ncbi:MAG: response regulator transcription factor [Kiritimatiellia bacterium]
MSVIKNGCKPKGAMAQQQTILVVEDEESIREMIRMTLELNGFSVIEADDGEAALVKAQKALPDLILLDWMLPGLDGLAVLRQLKKSSPELAAIPVVMLTAKGEESDIVLGLEMGAADYISKPFSNKVLVARIRTQLRQGEKEIATEAVRCGQLLLLPGERCARLGTVELDVTCGEFDLLMLLASHPGHVYTRGQIVVRTKGDDYPVTDRAIDVQMVNLRRKLGDWGDHIETVRGVGYRMRGESKGTF